MRITVSANPELEAEVSPSQLSTLKTLTPDKYELRKGIQRWVDAKIEEHKKMSKRPHADDNLIGRVILEWEVARILTDEKARMEFTEAVYNELKKIGKGE
jgi:hypothetical protein